MNFKQTVFTAGGIFRRLPEKNKPKMSDMYLYAKGVQIALTKSQISNIEAIIDNDYKAIKAFIKQSKKVAPIKQPKLLNDK